LTIHSKEQYQSERFVETREISERHLYLT